MGGADFIHILYSEFLNFDPSDMTWPLRDRFFLDPGHMSPMLYSIQTLVGNFSLNDIENFRQWGSPTPGHPELDVERGIENTSGPLGLGHAFGAGAAVAERFLQSRFGDVVEHKTYIYISDGGIQEEISQGVGRIAGHLGLGNIIMFYDANDIQLSTEVDVVTTEDTAKKYESWGWQVMTIEGNNQDAIRTALKTATENTDQPTIIIGKTIMGKGAVTEGGESFESEVETHGQPLSKAGASFAKTIENLGGDSENPFAIFPEVAAYYKEILSKKQAWANEKKATFSRWAAANPELDKKFQLFLSGDTPN